MPEFVTPFSCKKSDRKLTNEELIRAVRFAISSEYEAIQIYEEIAESVDNEDARKTFYEISGDEKIHVGNLCYLLSMLSPGDKQLAKKGEEEIIKFLKND